MTTQATMHMRNWFDVGIRLIGLWEIVAGLDQLVTYLNTMTKLFTTTTASPNAYLTHALAHVLIGIFLLLYATSIANAVYPTKLVADGESADAT